ncbi:MAG: type II toxin-antitoxin system RelE/ParE family toxin [Myxococcales bacterium]|nr:type II toxin-antitoxin system RelE/ParE family toxin [Myxococcales bacterium]
MPLIYSEAAADELADAAAFYEAHRPNLGERFLQAVTAAERLIREYPEAWPRGPGGCRTCGLRDFPYRLWFTCEGESTLVLAVAHTSWRPGYWHDRG